METRARRILFLNGKIKLQQLPTPPPLLLNLLRCYLLSLVTYTKSVIDVF